MTEQELIFEEKKMRSEAQLELVKNSIDSRHQTVVNIAVNSIAVIAVAGYIKSSPFLFGCITALLLLSLAILWYDILVTRTTLQKSQEKLNEILGLDFAAEAEAINKGTHWALRNFVEIAGVLFSLLVFIFLVTLFISPKDEFNATKSNHRVRHHERWNLDISR